MKDKDKTKEQLINELNWLGQQVTTLEKLQIKSKSEKEINKRQQVFASLFHNSPEALVYVDEKSNILNINPRLSELFLPLSLQWVVSKL
jgi:transcriptional regulator with PAS, ATPase and Fis domain